MTAFRLAAAPLLLMAAAHAAWATPEDSLLAELSGEFRGPQLRCEWIAGRFDTIERRLSLYREELAAVQVQVDGIRVGDSMNGAVMLLAFESRLLGPASATITLDQRYAGSLDRLRAGRRIEISFTDRAGKSHPLFCGIVAIVRANPLTRRTDVVALIPRAGAELQQSALYQDQSCADVLTGLAQTAGLAIEVTDQRPRSTFPMIARKNLATWPFMRQAARQCRMDLALQTDGKLLVSESSFVPPPVPPSRTWTDMTWVNVAASLAQAASRAADVRLTGSYPRTNFRQTASDEDFLLEISTAAQASAWYTPGKLMIAEDGAWLRDSVQRPAPDGTTELLLKRVIVTGSGASPRSFSRRYADARAQALDLERVPTVEVALLLGRAMPVATLPAFPLASATRITAALESALVRLGSQSATAERRFLQDLARVYRPTLVHIYRLKADGEQILDAIGR